MSFNAATQVNTSKIRGKTWNIGSVFNQNDLKQMLGQMFTDMVISPSSPSWDLRT